MERMGEQRVEEQLKELGSKLESPPSNKDSVLKLLKQATICLSEIDQSPSASVLEMMQPFLHSIVKPELLRNQDRDVKLLVATCICEITRITAPNAPYSDDLLKDIFHLIVGTFSGLSDTGGPSFGRRVVILETLAKYRSCVVMLDLECYDLVKKMFTTFFTVASDDHQESVLLSMQTVMVVLIEESEDVRDDLLLVILSALGRNRSGISAAARRLAMNVIELCAGKLEASIKQFLVSSISGDKKLENNQIDYHEVIYDIYRCAPQILSGVVPYLTGELLTDQLDTRLKAVGLVGDLFALPDSAITEMFQPVFSEFLKRLTDRVVVVRMSVLEHVKNCLLSNPFRIEAPQIITALYDRLLDYDENVRKQVVDVICNVACQALNSVPDETIKLVSERLRDKSLLVKRYTMERLAEVFRVYCMKSSDGSVGSGTFDWIPGKIFRCFYDKDFRSDTIESVLCGSLFPEEFSVKDRVRHWVRVFSVFDKVEMKAFEKILEQKQRIQQEMQRYLSLRQMQQDGDATEIHKKVLFCFRFMSRLFAEPGKAEENFQILDQLKDANIWKIMTNLLDPNTSFHQASAARDDLLKIVGEKHRLHDFLSTLSMKCSYVLFNKEHVKEILSEAASHKLEGNMRLAHSCMDILVILARFSPLLFCGAEEELVNFLKDDNEILKEGALHILAKAGGTIREQLPVSSSSMDLILERLCLEGSRRQAKYAVHALAAITKDDGLKSLSVLYKRLVDMLDENRNLPAILQSLGCIAQTAMPVFETRESEVADFIRLKILDCNSKLEDHAKSCWNDRSDLCLLKIYGIKTLVKSYLPVKDAQLRPGIDNLLGILRNILLFGEVSEDINSSLVDKAHLRLASAKAILRLSKQWDHKLPVDLFHLTLRTSEIGFPEARKLFLNKVHQYIKDRLLDAKYACSFLFNDAGSKLLNFEEEKQNLIDIIQMHHQAKARQLPVQSDTNPLAAYPEYILPYLVHALAHHSCPDVDKFKDVNAFEPIYRKLYLWLSLLVPKDEDVKSEGGSSKEKESISAIVSIFQSIKNSEDVVDVTKTKNSHAISELGFSIIKRLAPKDDDIHSFALSISLPPMLYKSYEKKEGDESLGNEEKTWLGDESVLTHFESLKLEIDGMGGSNATEEEVPMDSETEGNEVPLGEMLKRLKSQGSKSGKAKRSKSFSAKVEHPKSNVDILKMVREINIDNLGPSDKFESSNGHKHSPSEEINLKTEHQKIRKREASEMTSVSVPKRRRSISAHGAFSLSPHTSKILSQASGDDSIADSKDKKLMPKKSKSTKSDLLASVIQKKGSVAAKHKGKSSDLPDHHDDQEVEAAIEDNLKKSNVLEESDNVETADIVKSLTGSLKKRKRQSIVGLAKWTKKDSGIDNEELIGCRIKVWWPMDKQFYEGTIKSYDPLKGKHVILYGDGDVEVLRLEKERWELVDNGHKSRKKLKSLKSPTSAGVLAAHKNKSSGGHQSKKSVKMVKGKRTPKLKRREHGVKDDLDVLDPELRTPSEGDKTKQGDYREDSPERMTENQHDMEESDKEVTSVSKGENLDHTEETPNHLEESGIEVKSKLNISRNLERKSHAKRVDAEEDPISEEDENDKSDEDLVEESHEEKPDHHDEEPIKPTHTNRKSRLLAGDPSDTGDAGFSDDEPLCNWKHKVGKLASRRAR